LLVIRTMNHAQIAGWMAKVLVTSGVATTLFMARVAFAVPLATAAQVSACTNAVIFRLNGIPRSNISATAGSLEADGTGLVNWSTTNGGSGFCWVDPANQVTQVEVEVEVGISQTPRPITRPMATGGTMQVITEGGSLNVRSSPGGEIVGSVANGSTVVLTGKSSDEWVEIEAGGWVAQYHLIEADADVAAVPDAAPTNSETTNSETAAPVAGPRSREAEVVAENGVNIRSSPDGDVIASVPQGATVILTGQAERGWVEIEGGGWVAEAYLQYR
jgi:uncharacterized protein YgiM (DUF1202 family)